MRSSNIDKMARERFAALNRRQFLRGLGACVALPALETFLPAKALDSEPDPGRRLATTATGAPMRFGVVYFPNGAIQPNWWPKGENAEFELSQTMDPLQKLKNQLQVLGGMDQVNAMPGPDGAGDHARASGTFLRRARQEDRRGGYPCGHLD
jgi:hypothetical protein